MQFTYPTTKSELHAVLEQIYHHYRIERGSYVDYEVQPLEIPRMEHTPLDAAALTQKAETLLAPTHELRLIKYREDLNRQASEIDAKIAKLDEDYDGGCQKIEEKYAAAKIKLERDGVKRGVENSTVVADRLAALDAECTEKLVEFANRTDELKLELYAKRTELMERISGAEDYYAPVYQSELAAEIVKLKDEDQKLAREALKYNNDASEREIKYANTLKQTKASIELRYMQIQNLEFSKEQLVEMGYYTDVMDCIAAYYDLLLPYDAWYDIGNDAKLMFYLDDYYETTLYMYRQRYEASR